MPPFAFEDARFDDPAAGWVEFHVGAHDRQRHLPHTDRIYSETVVDSRGSVEDAIRLLRGRWEWWQHGSASGFQQNADGSTSQVLAPVWWNFPRMALQIFPGIALPDTDPAGAGGIRLPMLVSRNFRGVASIDVFPRSPGGVVIRGRYHGVENHIPLMPLGMATRIHLRAEAGNLSFPFPSGTGFPGLLRRLSNG